MKITSFNPLIVSKDAQAAIQLFEELGFEKKHVKVSETNNMAVDTVRMGDPNGFHVDVAQLDPLPRDMTAIRMNVDDLDEAEALLLRHGFVNTNPEKTVENPTHLSRFMTSPSGFSINLVKHLKNNP